MLHNTFHAFFNCVMGTNNFGWHVTIMYVHSNYGRQEAFDSRCNIGGTKHNDSDGVVPYKFLLKCYLLQYSAV